MLLYTIHANAEAPPTEFVGEADIRARAAELSGRPGILSGSIATKLRREGRVYIAGNRRPGFVIRRHQH